jgi:hypothetical protein
MSEQAPEAPARPAPSGGGGKLGVWSKKLGPLPAWGWAAILLVVIIIYMYYRNRNSSTTASGSVTSADTANGSTPASDIPQFVNQTYTTVTPPAAPPTPTGTPTPTTGGQIPGHHVITSNGQQTLAQIASANGTTAADIIAFSKAHKPHISATEAKFFSKPNGKVPKGIVLWVPEPQVTNVTGPGPGGATSSG